MQAAAAAAAARPRSDTTDSAGLWAFDAELDSGAIDSGPSEPSPEEPSAGEPVELEIASDLPTLVAAASVTNDGDGASGGADAAQPDGAAVCDGIAEGGEGPRAGGPFTREGSLSIAPADEMHSVLDIADPGSPVGSTNHDGLDMGGMPPPALGNLLGSLVEDYQPGISLGSAEPVRERHSMWNLLTADPNGKRPYCADTVPCDRPPPPLARTCPHKQLTTSSPTRY